MRTVWDVLGIAETQDVAAIRSAYARTLKTIDVDTEPQLYIELRNARDQAMHDAREAAAVEPRAAASDPNMAAAEGASPAIAQGAFEEHRTALAGLLMPETDGVVSPIDDGLLRAHFAALLRDPRMADIAFAARAEMQMSELIAMTLPQSAALAEPAVRAFGWHGTVNVDTPPAIAAIRDAVDKNREDRGFVDAPGREQDDPDVDPDAAFRAAEYGALVALLMPQIDDPPPLTGEQEDAARRHFESLLVDPRMDVVTFRVGAEAQLAQLIAYAIPRSDCIVDRAVDFFDWRMEEGRVDQSGAVAYILNRERGLRFRAAVQRPEHPHHVAWTELTTPPDVKRRFWKYVPDTSVAQLLAAIRTEQPLLERDLDPESVAKWDHRLSLQPPPRRSSGTPSMPLAAKIWLGILAMTGMLSMFGQLSNPQDQYNSSNYERTAAPPSDLVGGQSTPVEDIGPVLAEIAGRDLTLSGLHQSNPSLANELETAWEAARDQKVGISDFQRGVEKMLLGRIAAIIKATDDLNLVVDYQKLRLEELKRRMSTPAECADLAQPGKIAVHDLPTELSVDQKALFAKILSDRYAPIVSPSASSAMIDDAVVNAVASKMSARPDAARQILLGKSGSVIERCFARIAELEVLLAMPGQQNASMLRAL